MRAHGLPGGGGGVERRDVRPFGGGDPGWRQLVDPGLQVGRRPAVRRGPRRGRTPLGRRGHPLHRPRPELRSGHPRARPPGDHRRDPRRSRRRHVVRGADAARDEARRGDRRTRPVVRAGAVHELGHRGHEHRRPAGTRLHRSRPGGDLPRQLPRCHRCPARRRWQRRRHARAAGYRGRPGRCGGRDARRPVQRGAHARRVGGVRDGRTDRRQHGIGRPAPWLSRGVAGRMRPGRRRVGVRRGDQRVPGRAGRSPAAVFGHARPHHVRQGDRWRSSDRLRRWTAPDHGDAVADRARLPRRHAGRQSARHGGRPGSAERARRRRLRGARRSRPAAGGDDGRGLLVSRLSRPVPGGRHVDRHVLQRRRRSGRLRRRQAHRRSRLRALLPRHARARAWRWRRAPTRRCSWASPTPTTCSTRSPRPPSGQPRRHRGRRTRPSVRGRPVRPRSTPPTGAVP